VCSAGEPAPRLVIIEGGQHVGAFEPLQLQAVLQQTQKFIRRGEVRGIVTSDITTGTQGGQRIQGGAHMQRLVAATMDELKQLHRELDVP